MAPLKIGILVSSDTLPFWAENILQFIEKTSSLELCVVIQCISRPLVEKRSVWAKLNTGNLLYKYYSKWERRRVSDALPMTKQVSLAASTMGVDCIEVGPADSQSILQLSGSNLSQVASYQCDIIFNLSLKILERDIFRCARFGVWSFSHGDIDLYRGGPAGYWEVYDHAPHSSATLLVWSEADDKERIHGKSFVPTDDGSFLRNRDNLSAAGIRLAEDALLSISKWNGSPEQFLEENTEECTSHVRKLRSTPSNWEMIHFLVQRVILRYLRKLFITRKREIWAIGLCRSEKEIFPPVIEEPKWHPPEAGSFIADPFLASHEGRSYVFYEDYDFTQEKGKICVAEILQNLDLGPPRIALETEFHLSFPMVFRYRHAFYMLPEQSQSGRLSLYRAEHFPHKWKECHVIFPDMRCADPVLFFNEQRWWLFLTKLHGNVNQNNLYLYSASSPFEKFEPHPRNPIHFQLRGSRMAGCLFRHGTQLIRPGQDCSKNYGGGIVFYEVVKLDPDSYVEREVTRAGPIAAGGFSEKFHTYNSAGGVAAFDGSRYEPPAEYLSFQQRPK